MTGLSASSGSAGSTITINGQNFSGAAGNLSVFFGTTAATVVTYISDSQITAVVPSGTGTVNVTVQSGVNETDPNNPSDNVNAPIFGYGTSAIIGGRPVHLQQPNHRPADRDCEPGSQECYRRPDRDGRLGRDGLVVATPT